MRSMTFCNTGPIVSNSNVIMDSHAENTRRIAKNTLMLYIRMLFGMAVSLYTSRVVLDALGTEDYGIYNVVGGFVVMFSLISGSLSSSVSRFLTFELGRGDMKRLKDAFSTSLLIHVILACVVFIAAESIGLWFINNQMNIPSERLYAANWVFQASVVGFMFSLISVPYNASIISHEKMGAFAYIGILDVVLRLLVVLFVAYWVSEYDKLITYSLLLLFVGILLQCIYLWYCRKHFEECCLYLYFNKQYWKEMSAFAGWNFIGCTAGLLKDQGVNILLNIFIGPIINAARGIAGSVNAVTAFASNFMTALNPQIIKSYASGDKVYSFSLVERGSRFSFFILLVLAMPILFETEFILTIWLKQYPDHTANFVRLMLILALCDVLSNTLITLLNATGKIRNYQLAVGGMLMMNFPLSYLCLSLRLPPESTLMVAVFISICCMFLRLMFLQKMVGLSVIEYLKRVYLKVVAVVICASIIPMLVMTMMPSDGWLRFIVVCTACVVCTAFTIYVIGCTESEKNFISQKLLILKNKYLHL